MSNNVAQIKVIGVGGGGGNAIAHMANEDLHDVDFCVFNTDLQALNSYHHIENRYSLGESITKGLGAGANPDIGRQAAESDEEHIRNFIEGSNMVFITAGMGGGTGTGAAPVVARIAKEMNILTVAVVTKPFSFEGKKRMSMAEAGIAELEATVDSLIVIPNENLISTLGSNTKLTDAFAAVNDILLKAVKGVSELITRPGIINIDLNDMTTVIKNSGTSMIGIGIGKGPSRAKDAVDEALSSPLLDNLDIRGVKGLLINITASENLSIGDFHSIGEIVESYAESSAHIVTGTSIDETLGDSIVVTIVATGLSKKEEVNIDKAELEIKENKSEESWNTGSLFTISDNIDEDSDMEIDEAPNSSKNVKAPKSKIPFKIPSFFSKK